MTLHTGMANTANKCWPAKNILWKRSKTINQLPTAGSIIKVHSLILISTLNYFIVLTSDNFTPCAPCTSWAHPIYVFTCARFIPISYGSIPAQSSLKTSLPLPPVQLCYFFPFVALSKESSPEYGVFPWWGCSGGPGAPQFNSSLLCWNLKSRTGTLTLWDFLWTTAQVTPQIL